MTCKSSLLPSTFFIIFRKLFALFVLQNPYVKNVAGTTKMLADFEGLSVLITRERLKQQLIRLFAPPSKQRCLSLSKLVMENAFEEGSFATSYIDKEPIEKRKSCKKPSTDHWSPKSFPILRGYPL